MKAPGLPVVPGFQIEERGRKIDEGKKGGWLSTFFQLSTLFHKTISYNRLARKIAIANLGGPVKRKINWKEKKGKEKEGKTTILSYNK